MEQLLLNDYNLLNRDLATLTEEQLLKLIEAELDDRRRKTFVERIHQRYSKLKTARERADLMSKCK